MRIDKGEVFQRVKRLYTEVNNNDLSGVAAELAYRFFLALFPFFIFIASLGAFIADVVGVENPTDEIMNLVGESIPTDAASVLRGQVRNVVESHDAGLLSIGILGAIGAASSGVGALMKGMNRAYGARETRRFWKRYALAVGLTLLGGGASMVAFVLMVIGQVYGLKIAAELGVEGFAASLFTLARWPLLILFVTVAIAVLYWAAPNVKLPFRWITPGSALFTAAWLLISYLFGLYVANFGSFNTTYGALGGVAVTLIWFYLSGLILLSGAQLNALLSQELLPEELPHTPDTAPDDHETAAAASLSAEGQSAGLRRAGQGGVGAAMTRAGRTLRRLWR